MRPVLVAIAVGLCATAFAHDEESQAPGVVDYSRAEATPFGIAADPRKAKRTIRVEMNDAMRFTPSEIEVWRGDVVRIVAANKGEVLHEMVLGTMEGLNKHAALMKRFPGMEHDAPYMAHVAPGKSGEIGWRFTSAGTYYFACLIPGHFEAGMAGKISVR